MPGHNSPSPVRRPKLNDRTASEQSLSRDTAGHLSRSHKGSSTKLHKAHAVGHGRHTHGRIPSYGKGLSKLSKLGPGNAGEGAPAYTKHHTRSASQTPSTSPTSQNNIKRNSSNISLPRPDSRGSIKKNVSSTALPRNRSSTKLGNQSKSEKAHTKLSLQKKGTDDAPLKGTANFSVGDDDQDDEWTEESNSQSPYKARHSSVGRKPPHLEDPPSPDEPPVRSPHKLPHSPPESPPTNPSAFAEHVKEDQHHKPVYSFPYSHPPNAEDVTHRLLNRSTHNAAPKMSSVSATITPNGSTGSPAFNHSHDSTLNQEPSMPADGISRFLSGTGSNSGSATPGSVSHLQSHLAHLPRTIHHDIHRSDSPTKTSSITEPKPSRRVKSAADLTHPGLSNGESSSLSPPKEDPPPPNRKRPTNPPRISPFESARDNDPSAGKSLTQLKLDLQRMSTQRDTPSSQHPVMQHGSVIGIQNLSAGSSEMASRLTRQYQQANLEFRNARRFYNDLLVGNLAKKGLSRKVEEARNKSAKAPVASVTSVGSSGERRGRVRFEVGRSSGEADRELDAHGESEADGGVDGLLRRMWEHQDVGEGVGVEE